MKRIITICIACILICTACGNNKKIVANNEVFTNDLYSEIESIEVFNYVDFDTFDDKEQIRTIFQLYADLELSQEDVPEPNRGLDGGGSIVKMKKRDGSEVLIIATSYLYISIDGKEYKANKYNAYSDVLEALGIPVDEGKSY